MLLYKLKKTVSHTSVGCVRKDKTGKWRDVAWRDVADGGLWNPNCTRRVDHDSTVLLVEVDKMSFWEPVAILLFGEETVFYSFNLFQKEFEPVLFNDNNANTNNSPP